MDDQLVGGVNDEEHLRNLEAISHATRVDPVLSRVLEFVRSGPQHIEDLLLKPFFHRRYELSIEQDSLVWEIRVVIPTRYQKDILDELH
ncbi:hypothetical protein P5673_033117, partial [Acropora cervicornis]